jgi:hypothetical protein
VANRNRRPGCSGTVPGGSGHGDHAVPGDHPHGAGPHTLRGVTLRTAEQDRARPGAVLHGADDLPWLDFLRYRAVRRTGGERGWLSCCARQQPFGLATAAALLIAVALGVFFIRTFPINQATSNWTLATDGWMVLRARWEYSHAANALLIFSALCCTTWASLHVTHGQASATKPDALPELFLVART